MDNVTVSFQYERAHITLNYPLAITDMPQTSLKKLFKLMVSDYRREANEEAVRTTHEALKAYVVETKKTWNDASIDFQTGFVDTKYHYCSNVRAATANNKRLLNTVKSAKAKHERAKKLLTFFEEVKDKYFD